MLKIAEKSSANQIQVICSNAKGGRTMESDTLESFFSHPRYTGIEDSSALQSVDQKTNLNNLPVFVVTYATSQGKYAVTQPQWFHSLNAPTYHSLTCFNTICLLLCHLQYSHKH